MVGPGARKPSVGEGIESRRPLFCSAITTLHSLFIYLFVLSFIFTFASILVCVNNNNNIFTLGLSEAKPSFVVGKSSLELSFQLCGYEE